MNNTLALICSLLLLPAAAFAQCTTAQPEDLTISWKAFKTPLKVGVGGTLTAISAEGARKAPTWQQLVLNQELTITADGGGIDSGDKVRDAKIAKFFFGEMYQKHRITAQVTAVDEKKSVLTLRVKMNGETLDNVHLEYKKEGDTLKARGHIDILDFQAAKALKALNKACAALHEGKTWSDVAIGFTAKLRGC